MKYKIIATVVFMAFFILSLGLKMDSYWVVMTFLAMISVPLLIEECDVCGKEKFRTSLISNMRTVRLDWFVRDWRVQPRKEIIDFKYKICKECELDGIR